MLSGILKRFHDTINRFENNESQAKRAKHDPEDPNIGTQAGEGEKQSAEAKDATPPVLHGLEPLPQPERVYGDNINTQLDWLTEPVKIDTDERCSFESLGVSEKLRERLALLGYADAFAVQKAVISHLIKDQAKPGVLALSDILVQSATGSGKTLAYCIPCVEQALKYKVKRVSSLIIVPTRPLLAQVTKVLTDLTKNTQISVASLRQDRSLEQERALLHPSSRKTLPSIIVATPGRLADHLNEGTLDLKYLDFLVVDEADKLVGQSFSSWTDALSKAIPKSERPTLRRPARRLVFSATLTRDAGKLSQLQIRNSPTPPVVYVVGNETITSSDGRTREWTVPQGLTESLLRISSNDVKPLILAHELFKSKGKVLVFVSNNEAAARLSRLLSLLAEENGTELSVARCSGEMPAVARKRALKAFEDTQNAVLVCTDLVARGVDVAEVSLVVNYDLPSSAQEYVHRVGRTARANAAGTAWTLTSNTFERKSFWTMVSAINRSNKIDVREVVADAENEGYQRSLARLKEEASAQ